MSVADVVLFFFVFFDLAALLPVKFHSISVVSQTGDDSIETTCVDFVGVVRQLCINAHR